jgi:CRISPR/Cas system CMR subunit Cmr4 (Cas7 group RAMP superfamily)
MMNLNDYKKRYIANIAIETLAPLKVGSSDIDMLQDSPVQKDFNNMPMILGTSIAGVLRKEFDVNFANDIFGDENSLKKDYKASRIIISNALLCDENMKVTETLELNKSEFLKHFDNLPIREHVKITHKGVADTENTSKFDEEVVFKGSRFRFRIELIADENDKQIFRDVLKAINSKTFRLGGGTTKGFGDVKVLKEFSTYDVFDLNSEAYRGKSSSLNTTYDKELPLDAKEDIGYEIYTLKIKPDDFFMFGSGFGEDDIKMTPVYEKVIDYENKKLGDKEMLIPASSIKGALSHRTAFHYNKKNNLYVGNPDAKERITQIFGAAKNEDGEHKGKILISDCFKSDNEKTKVFDHVSIDRFTGGGIEGALFNEKTIYDDRVYEIEILLQKDIQAQYIEAFEDALKDIATGMLPLGGTVNKGHGVFKSVLGDEVYYEKK